MNSLKESTQHVSQTGRDAGPMDASKAIFSKDLRMCSRVSAVQSAQVPRRKPPSNIIYSTAMDMMSGADNEFIDSTSEDKTINWYLGVLVKINALI
jgi:hypothetical protein